MHGYLKLDTEKKNELICQKLLSTATTAIHFHSQIEIYLVCSGTVEVLINNEYRLLHGGEFSVALSYDTHGYRPIEKSEIIYMVVPTDILPDNFSSLLADKRLGEPFISDVATYSRLREAMEQLISAENELTARGYVYLILGAVLQLSQLEQRQEQRDTRFGSDVLIYISQNFREELSLTELAARFGYNPSYLSRHFKEAFGISFGKYLSTLRLREAVLLLKGGERNITECALESGFGSVRSFYRVFYEEFKCTPKEYIKNEHDASLSFQKGI